jgi:hypothetical protein
MRPECEADRSPPYSARFIRGAAPSVTLTCQIVTNANYTHRKQINGTFTIWTYGIALWGCASKSNISVMQRYQSKLLRTITNAPWYVTNQTLHSDLRIPYVRSVLQDYIHKHRSALEVHSNLFVEPVLHTTHTRRLKRRWTFDEINWGVVNGLTPGETT